MPVFSPSPEDTSTVDDLGNSGLSREDLHQSATLKGIEAGADTNRPLRTHVPRSVVPPRPMS